MATKKKVGRKKGEAAQAGRMFRIADDLRARRFGLTIRELAETFDVHPRTIRRDLDLLEEIGHPVERVEVAGEPGARLEDRGRASLYLSLRERYTLLAARGLLEVFDQTPFQEDVLSIISKVAASLPEEQRRDLEGLGDRFLYIPDGGTKGYGGKEEIIDELLTAVLKRHRVAYRYATAQGRRPKGFLEPYALVLYRQGLYVVGPRWSADDGEAHKQIRVHAVERFLEVERDRHHRFEVPADFQPRRHFQGAFGIHVTHVTQHVVLDFSPQAVTYLESRRYHPSQKKRRLPDGGIRLELDVESDNELVSFILGWGPLVRVREPEALKKRVTEQLEAALGRYAEP